MTFQEIIASLETRRAEICSEVQKIDIALLHLKSISDGKVNVSLPHPDLNSNGTERNAKPLHASKRLPIAEGYAGAKRPHWLKGKKRDPNSKAGKVRQAVEALIVKGAREFGVNDTMTQVVFIFGRDHGINKSEAAAAMKRMFTVDNTIVQSSVKNTGEILYRAVNPQVKALTPVFQTVTTSDNSSPFDVLDGLNLPS